MKTRKSDLPLPNRTDESVSKDNIYSIIHHLSHQLNLLQFSHPITHVYNPLEYARTSHEQYVKRYGEGTREILLLGMNPGPWGMAQNGIPFGDIVMVRDWLGIHEIVRKPPLEHPKRPILGFENPRREVSGKRLWGWARDRFGVPEKFFERFFVINFCPLAFFTESGQNLTPDKLCANDRISLLKICDESLRQFVEYYQPKHVIGVGRFAESSARRALHENAIHIGHIPHPSPASPLANRGWDEAVEQSLKEMGIAL